jgi:hypothetical protein
MTEENKNTDTLERLIDVLYGIQNSLERLADVISSQQPNLDSSLPENPWLSDDDWDNDEPNTTAYALGHCIDKTHWCWSTGVYTLEKDPVINLGTTSKSSLYADTLALVSVLETLNTIALAPVYVYAQKDLAYYLIDHDIDARASLIASLDDSELLTRLDLAFSLLEERLGEGNLWVFEYEPGDSGPKEKAFVREIRKRIDQCQKEETTCFLSPESL